MDSSNFLDEPVMIGRLGHVARDAQIVGGELVGLFLRGGEDDDRNALQDTVLLDRAQEFNPVHDRQVQVQNDNTGSFVIFILQELEGFLAVGDNID